MMPRQNRVTPFGDIAAIPDRGTMMGNRGRLHDDAGRIQRAWQVRRWLICRLEFRGRRRAVMSPNRYTELFFLDEATALAAGHRPCFECRREAFHRYATAWLASRSDATRPTADAIDAILHRERIGREGMKRSYDALLDDLPDGVIVTLNGDDARLIWKGNLREWSPAGYLAGSPLSDRERGGLKVKVLTPRSSVEVIRAGYVPEVHSSVEGM